jgi:hypothetical protein
MVWFFCNGFLRCVGNYISTCEGRFIGRLQSLVPGHFVEPDSSGVMLNVPVFLVPTVILMNRIGKKTFLISNLFTIVAMIANYIWPFRDY